MRRRTEVLTILVVLAAAAWLRFAQLGWGLPHAYHPDEGSILFHALGFGTGDLNPHWFRWPSLFMYKMFAVYGGYYAVGKATGLFAAPSDLVRQYLTDLTPFWLMGRAVSAAAGVATVWVTWLAGRRAFGVFAGLVSAAVMAVVYLHVRDSHYATPDVLTTLLASVSLLLAVSACGSGSARSLILSGLFAGLAASAKYPGVLAGAGTLTAWFVLAKRREVPAALIVPVALAAAVGFVAGTPYSVLSFDEFRHDVLTQFTMVSTSGPAAAPSLWAGLREIVFGTLGRGVGWLVVVFAAIGCLAPSRLWATRVESRSLSGDGGEGGRRTIAGASGAKAVLVAYALAFLFVMAILTVKRSTYMTPSLPAVAVLAACGLEAFFVSSRRAGRLALATLAALVVVALTAVPSVEFVSALAMPDTRTVAKVWFEENVPPGVKVAVETYCPVLNPLTAQLSIAAGESSTAVESWEGPKRRLAEMRAEVGRSRAPQYEVYGIDWGEGAFRLADPWEDPEALASQIRKAGIEYVVLSSKAQQARPMEGAAPPADTTPWAFSTWAGENATLLMRFTAAREVPVIDRGRGRSFHNPVIEVYRVTRPPAAPAVAPPEAAAPVAATPEGG